MARLTKYIRARILQKAIANVPTIDYGALLIPIVQDALCKHMPPEVKAVYDNEETRAYLGAVEVHIRDGNGHGGRRLRIMEPRGGGEFYKPHKFYGLEAGKHDLIIHLNAEVVKRLKKGTLMHTVTHAVIKSGYYTKHIEQSDLYDSVKERLSNTLASVTTIKRLYDVLEPELHHLIPKEGDKTVNLPATAAPVVADLRRLGANLPTVAKAG